MEFLNMRNWWSLMNPQKESSGVNRVNKGRRVHNWHFVNPTKKTCFSTLGGGSSNTKLRHIKTIRSLHARLSLKLISALYPTTHITSCNHFIEKLCSYELEWLQQLKFYRQQQAAAAATSERRKKLYQQSNKCTTTSNQCKVLN